MNIQNLNDEELAIEIRGRCITNMAADDLVKFIRQCVDDSQVKPLPSKPEPTVTQKLLKAQALHGGVTSDDKLAEENKRLKEALEKIKKISGKFNGGQINIQDIYQEAKQTLAKGEAK